MTDEQRIEEAVKHLSDAPLPEEKSITDQLIENTKISVSGFPIPTKIEIKGYVEF